MTTGRLCAVLMAATMLTAATAAQAETLRILTWGGYAPDELVQKFEEKYPDIDVEVTLSNNEEMIAKLRANVGAGFDLAQPSHDRIYPAQLEYYLRSEERSGGTECVSQCNTRGSPLY